MLRRSKCVQISLKTTIITKNATSATTGKYVPYSNTIGQFSNITPITGRPGSSEVPRNPLTRWDVSSNPANGIFLTKILKNKNKNAQRVEND